MKYTNLAVAFFAVVLFPSTTRAANNYYNHTNAFVGGAVVRSSEMNTKFNNIAAGFDKLPAPHSGAPGTKGWSEIYTIQDGTARNHPISIGQFQDVGSLLYNTATGTDTYALNLTPDIAAYSAGQRFVFKPQNNNTGASTLNVDGLGAKAMKRPDGSDLLAGELDADGIYSVVYDGTYFAVLGLPLVYDQTLNTTDDVEFNSLTTDTVTSSGGGVTVDGAVITNPIAVTYGGTGSATAQGALGNIMAGVPAASAYLSSDETIADSSDDLIINWTEIYDTGSDWDEAGNLDKFLPDESGTYFYTVDFEFDNNSGGDITCKVIVYKNGVSYHEYTGSCADAVNTSQSTRGMVVLNGTTDYIQLYAYQDSGGTSVDLNSGTAPYKTTMSIVWISP